MSFGSYSKLLDLHKKHGPQEFGRVCQAFLEMSLRGIGFKTRGRPVERPDISAERHEEKYAIEAKAPIGAEVSITDRDLAGLYEFATAGVVPVVAVLLVEPNQRWILAKGRNLKPGAYNKVALSAYDINALSSEVNAVFPGILADHFDLAMGRGSEGLRARFSRAGV